MDAIKIAIICVAVLLVIILIRGQSEGFSTVEEKAQQLSGWMTQHPTAPYVEYIQANPESNIVEYTKLRDITGTSARGSPSQQATSTIPSRERLISVLKF